MHTGGGGCIGFNVFSNSRFSFLLGQVQQQLHHAPLAWLDRQAWPVADKTFVAALLPYALAELADGIGLVLPAVASALVTRHFQPLTLELPLAMRLRWGDAAVAKWRAVCGAGPGAEELAPALVGRFRGVARAARAVAGRPQLVELGGWLSEAVGLFSDYDAEGAATPAAAEALMQEVIESMVIQLVGLPSLPSYVAGCLAQET